MAHLFTFPTKDASIFNQTDFLLQNSGIDAILEIEKRIDPNTGNPYFSRTLIQFDTTAISNSIALNNLTNYQAFLNLKTSDAREVPLQYNLLAYPISQSWQMGVGRKYDGSTSEGVSWKFRSGQNEGDVWYSSSYISSASINTVTNGNFMGTWSGYWSGIVSGSMSGIFTGSFSASFGTGSYFSGSLYGSASMYYVSGTFVGTSSLYTVSQSVVYVSSSNSLTDGTGGGTWYTASTTFVPTYANTSIYVPSINVNDSFYINDYTGSIITYVASSSYTSSGTVPATGSLLIPHINENDKIIVIGSGSIGYTFIGIDYPLYSDDIVSNTYYFFGSGSSTGSISSASINIPTVYDGQAFYVYNSSSLYTFIAADYPIPNNITSSNLYYFQGAPHETTSSNITDSLLSMSLVMNIVNGLNISASVSASVLDLFTTVTGDYTNNYQFAYLNFTASSSLINTVEPLIVAEGPAYTFWMDWLAITVPIPTDSYYLSSSLSPETTIFYLTTSSFQGGYNSSFLSLSNKIGIINTGISSSLSGSNTLLFTSSIYGTYGNSYSVSSSYGVSHLSGGITSGSYNSIQDIPSQSLYYFELGNNVTSSITNLYNKIITSSLSFISTSLYNTHLILSASLSGSIGNLLSFSQSGSYNFTNYLSGSNYPVTTSLQASQSFLYQTSDVRMDVTNIVNSWVQNEIPNNGFIILHDKETDTNDYGSLKFFSKETNTIYTPTLEFCYDDSSYFTTGSITNVNLNLPYVSYVSNDGSSYKNGSVVRFDVFARERYPKRTFSHYSDYTDTQYLPTSSYYSIKDANSEEIYIDFDQYSKISADLTGNYFILDTTVLPQERYYTVLIKVEHNGKVDVFNSNSAFKITR